MAHEKSDAGRQRFVLPAPRDIIHQRRQLVVVRPN